jgi:hypothetical protein
MNEPILGKYQLVNIGIGNSDKCKVLSFRAVIPAEHVPHGIKFVPYDDTENFTVCSHNMELIKDVDPGEFFEIILRRTKA